ncbi:hypothetical protein ML462_15945 [Gramella lutea]|uniref:Uncharacterized protein n=1 Tax=Christiangramia lutea TaxID=1607951 RepID=A0A9X1V941_9FLAO|nr:hypothetical protein [Christiangramia lutea]MCH4824663.1 hypothetical protein [Christiangramia lutea]
MKSYRILYFIIFISFNSYSQKLFKEYGEREYSDTLNIELLHKICDNSELEFSDIYVNKSNSVSFQSDTTFFAIQYILKNTEDGNLYTTKYLLAKNSNGKVLAQLDDSDSYYDKEAVQPSPSYILKNPIKLSTQNIGIGVITEESVRSCATIYSKQKISIFTLTNNKLNRVLENYPIRESHGESNCAGNYEIEILHKSVERMKSKTHGLFDLFITKKFTYEKVIEKNEDDSIEGKNIKKDKYETEKLLFDGEKYKFKEDNVLRFLK